MSKVVAVDEFYRIRKEMAEKKALADHDTEAKRFQGSAGFNVLREFFFPPVSVKYKFDLSKKVNEAVVSSSMTVGQFVRNVQARWHCRVNRVVQSKESGYETVSMDCQVGDLGDKPLFFSVSQFILYATVNGVHIPGSLYVQPEQCLEDLIRNNDKWGPFKGQDAQAQFCVVDCNTHSLVNLRKSAKQLGVPNGILNHRLNIVTRRPIRPKMADVSVCIGAMPRPVKVRIDINNPIPVDKFLACVAEVSPVAWIKEHGIVLSGSREITGKSFVYNKIQKLVVKDRNEVQVSVQYCGLSGNGPIIGLSLKRTDEVGLVKELYLGNTKQKFFDKSSVFVFDRESNDRFEDSMKMGDVADKSNGKLVIQGEQHVYIHVVGYTPDEDELEEIQKSYSVTKVLREIANKYRKKYTKLGPGFEVAFQRRCKRSGETVDCGCNSILRDASFEDYDTLVILFKNPGPRPTTTTAFTEVDPRGFRLEMTGWKKERELGRGSYGVVEEYVRPDSVHVAVKILDDFNESELRLMLALRRNSAIVTTYGSVTVNDRVGIVMEMLPRSLAAVIRKSGKERRDSQLTSTEEYIVLLGIAYGMRYCHSKHVIHRDLKPANILLDDNNRPRITDFGESVRTENDTMHETMRGTAYYMAPEIMNGDPYDEKVDVFSFACILYEMLTGGHLSTAKTQFTYFNAIVNGTRPEIPDEIASKPLGDLLERCWQGDPRARPSFEEIFECLGQEKYFFDWCDDFDQEAVTDYIEELLAFD